VHPDPGLDVGHGDPIDTRGPRPGITCHTFPRVDQERRVIDEVEQITEPASGIVARPTVQLELHLRTENQAVSTSGQATTPVFTGVSPSIAVVSLTDTLPPFPMRRAFPGSEYYGGSVPSAPSAGIGPIQRQHSPVERYTGTNTDGSHVHCCSVNGLGIRLYPCGIATATP
jgi:hypothetical protein